MEVLQVVKISVAFFLLIEGAIITRAMTEDSIAQEQKLLQAAIGLCVLPVIALSCVHVMQQCTSHHTLGHCESLCDALLHMTGSIILGVGMSRGFHLDAQRSPFFEVYWNLLIAGIAVEGMRFLLPGGPCFAGRLFDPPRQASVEQRLWQNNGAHVTNFYPQQPATNPYARLPGYV